MFIGSNYNMVGSDWVLLIVLCCILVIILSIGASIAGVVLIIKKKLAIGCTLLIAGVVICLALIVFVVEILYSLSQMDKAY